MSKEKVKFNFFKINYIDSIKVYVLIISWIVAIFMFIHNSSALNANNPYNLYSIIPFSFGILFLLITPNIEQIKENIGLLILIITMFLRYVILPLISCLGEYYGGIGINPSDKFITQAIWLMLYELIMVFVFLKIISKKYYSTPFNVLNTNRLKTISHPNYIFFIVIILGILVFFLFPNARPYNRFIFDANTNTNTEVTMTENIMSSGYFLVLMIVAKQCMILLFLDYFYKKYLKNHTFRYIFLSYFIVMLSFLYQSELSRFGILIPLIIYFVFLNKLYGDRGRIIGKIFILLGLCALVFVSNIKFFGNNQSNDATNIKYWASTFETYFMGVKDIAIGILSNQEINRIYGSYRIIPLLRDSISNVGGLSHFAGPLNQLPLLIYNSVYLNTSKYYFLILPNICRGLYYFGYILSPLVTLFFVFLIAFFDKKMRNCDDFYILFLYLLSSVYCSFIMMMNASTIVGNLINTVLYLSVCLLLNSKLVIHKT